MTDIHSTFKSLIGSRLSTVDNKTTEFFDLTNGKGFSDANQLASFLNSKTGRRDIGAGNVFDVLRSGSQFNVPVPPTIPKEITTQFKTGENPMDELRKRIATQDTERQRLLAEREQTRQLILESLQPSSEEQGLIKDLQGLRQQSRELALSFRAGVDRITGQPIPMSLIIGQSAQLARQAERQLESLSIAQAPLNDRLSLLQTARQSRLTQLNALQQFVEEDMADGRADIEMQMNLYNVAREYEKDQRQEQEAARDFALERQITTPYYLTNGTIYKTSDGKAYSTPEEFFADAGVSSFEEAGARSLISEPGPSLEEQKFKFEQSMDTARLGLERQRVGLEGARVNIARRELALKEAETSEGAGTYREQRTGRILESVAELRSRVSKTTVGPGSVLAFFPGTQAANFAADLETLKANIAFSELQAMREASKTGGALGQIAVQELVLLEATLGSLKTNQSPTNFIKNLDKIEESLNRWDASTGALNGGTDLDSLRNKYNY